MFSSLFCWTRRSGLAPFLGDRPTIRLNLVAAIAVVSAKFRVFDEGERSSSCFCFASFLGDDLLAAPSLVAAPGRTLVALPEDETLAVRGFGENDPPLLCADKSAALSSYEKFISERMRGRDDLIMIPTS